MKTRILIIIVLSSLFVISTSAVLWPEYGMICNNAVTTHLKKYSNLFDENTTKETYGILEIGLPFGVHPGNVKECIDFVLEKRSSLGLEKNTDLDKIEIVQISKSEILSKGMGFDLPEDTFTQEDLKQLQQKEKELRKTVDNLETSEEKRLQIKQEIREMQDRLQYPFQNGMPYHLVKEIKEKFVILENNFDDARGEVHFSVLGPSHISSEHHALRMGIHPEYFGLSELESQDKKIREYLGNEMNILYESASVTLD